MTNYIKAEVEVMQDKVDVAVGKRKRFLWYGWMAKPAWARALVWFCIGLVIGAALK